ncbi:ATP synthase subunit g, mitochondrial [Suricata suricatta]|uniref:ATP synthase subunit n=1 Tax=Suricata suricatta TaxID=37032 RepID=A0A673VDT5_SURSU|nr:ATP synthase subunit g, mitochondrial [Suricata suricatta]
MRRVCFPSPFVYSVLGCVDSCALTSYFVPSVACYLFGSGGCSLGDSLRTGCWSFVSVEDLPLALSTKADSAAAVTYSKPRLATFWHYAKVELVPPTPAEVPAAIQSLKQMVRSAQTGGFKQLTVKEALLNGVVATEVWMWFYVGEIIGKRGIIGYDV